jgi:hypothetical protein
MISEIEDPFGEAVEEPDAQQLKKVHEQEGHNRPGSVRPHILEVRDGRRESSKGKRTFD